MRCSASLPNRRTTRRRRRRTRTACLRTIPAPRHPSTPLQRIQQRCLAQEIVRRKLWWVQIPLAHCHVQHQQHQQHCQQQQQQVQAVSAMLSKRPPCALRRNQHRRPQKLHQRCALPPQVCWRHPLSPVQARRSSTNNISSANRTNTNTSTNSPNSTNSSSTRGNTTSSTSSDGRTSADEHRELPLPHR